MLTACLTVPIFHTRIVPTPMVGADGCVLESRALAETMRRALLQLTGAVSVGKSLALPFVKGGDVDAHQDTVGQRTDDGQVTQRKTWLAPRLVRMGSVTERTRKVNNKGNPDSGSNAGHDRT